MPRTCAMVAAALVLAGAVPRANRDDRPALAVLAFSASRPSFTGDQAIELADDLATRLVDTGRFRVLPLEWLTGADPSRRSPVADVRRAAREAGVRYLVSGSITDVTSRAAPTARTLLGTAAGVILARRQAAHFPVRCAPPPRVQQFSAIKVIVVDVESGAIVRTVLARTRPTDPSAGQIAPCLGGSGFPGPGSTRGRQPGLESLKLANAEIANTLTLLAPTAADIQEEP